MGATYIKNPKGSKGTGWKGWKCGSLQISGPGGVVTGPLDRWLSPVASIGATLGAPSRAAVAQLALGRWGISPVPPVAGPVLAVGHWTRRSSLQDCPVRITLVSTLPGIPAESLHPSPTDRSGLVYTGGLDGFNDDGCIPCPSTLTIVGLGSASDSRGPLVLPRGENPSS
ncbi:hypothetical protein N7492_003881 [Penicillium capsulatum]|uniref:Uncharacterized protein n=1 Tax=Penicillium capsulatum TaxID=69766 RepID=A0A9W9LWH8_9EURO|nr:hypothetical protein N7492_003881 [Penicillium capsulatum]